MRLPSLAFLIAAMVTSTAYGNGNTPPWSYDNDHTGQEEWGVMAREYSACEFGYAQSPVGINHTIAADLPSLRINYAPAEATVHPKDHTLVIAFSDASNTLTANNKTHRLREIRFHTPSEHTVLGMYYPMEIHLIHTDPNDKILILAVFVNNTANNPAIDALLPFLPGNASAGTSFRFDPSQLLPQGRGYYAYSGSLTHPPCTEGVEWRLFKQPIELSPEQIKTLVTHLKRNARIKQPIYMRTIQETVE